MDFVAWHGRTLTDHLDLSSHYQPLGYGFISLSLYGVTSSPHYAAVMIRPTPAAQHHYPSLVPNQWQQIFDSEAAQGYGPVIIAATGAASSPLYASVFEPQNPIALTRNGLTSSPNPWQLQQIISRTCRNEGASITECFCSFTGYEDLG
jgi:hypothetical protein